MTADELVYVLANMSWKDERVLHEICGKLRASEKLVEILSYGIYPGSIDALREEYEKVGKP